VLKRIAVIVAWVVATLATASITLAAVDQAGRQVSDRPAVPVAAEDLSARVTSTTTTTEPPPETTTTEAIDGSTTTSEAVTTTSTAPSASATTTSTTAPQASSTTTAPPSPATKSKATAGGTVVVSVSGSTLTLISAVPAQGYDVEVESPGPGEEVEVWFEKRDETVEYRVRASAEDGDVVWDVEVEHDD